MALTIKIDVDGAAELAAKFRLFETYMRAGLLPAWTQIAAILQSNIYARAPKKTGKLVRSTVPRVRPMHVKSIASAINPKDGYNYAWIQHYGGTAFYMGDRNKPVRIAPKMYMTIPLKIAGAKAPDILNDEIARIIALCGL